MKIVNPATEEVIGDIKEDSAKTVVKKFEKARAAQKDWAQTDLNQRLDVIRKFRNLILSEIETLAKTLTKEVGKPITQSRNEINGLMTRIDYFLEKTPAVLREESVFQDAAKGIDERIAHEPLGVVGNISAWNYPYFVGSNVFIPALLAGNAVLYKPSEYATLTGLGIAEVFKKSCLPPSLFTPIVGGARTGEALLDCPIDGLFFTGSYPTGKAIAQTMSKKMTKVQLEMGGKDPVYVCEDVDIESAAASLADGAFYNTGQSCCSVERLYVHQKIFSTFVEAFVNEVKKFKVGDPMDSKTYIGPVARKAQLNVLKAQVADAKTKGAKLLTGGGKIKGKGFFFEPTVFTNVDHSMKLMRDETFGPLIGIQKVRDDEEAVKRMNDTEYGLTAGVYTKDEERAREILSRIISGSVYWNCCDRVSPRLPWSGRGHSGIGLTLSTYGILAFTQPKAWHGVRA